MYINEIKNVPRPGPRRRVRDFTPLTWTEFFDRRDDIVVNETDVSLFLIQLSQGMADF